MRKNKKDLNFAHNRGTWDKVVGLINNNSKISSLGEGWGDVSERKACSYGGKLDDFYFGSIVFDTYKIFRMQ